MRTIKFRAWDKVNNRFIWLFSESVLGNIFSQSHSDEPQDVRQGRLFNRSDSEYELSQFTGLYDRNGKEVYEGDILCFPQYEGTKNQIRWVVQWNEKGARWSDWSPREEAVIIGNLYQNPELVNN